MKFLFKMVTRVIFVGEWVSSGLGDHARYLCEGGERGASERGASERASGRSSERASERGRIILIYPDILYIPPYTSIYLNIL